MTRFWRYYIMSTSTIIAVITVFAFLWIFTNCEIFTVLFWMVMFGMIAGALSWAATDPRRKPWNPDKVPFQNLDKEAYRKGGKR